LKTVTDDQIAEASVPNNPEGATRENILNYVMDALEMRDRLQVNQSKNESNEQSTSCKEYGNKPC
jgi:hypothetical protein